MDTKSDEVRNTWVWASIGSRDAKASKLAPLSLYGGGGVLLLWRSTIPVMATKKITTRRLMPSRDRCFTWGRMALWLILIAQPPAKPCRAQDFGQRYSGPNLRLSQWHNTRLWHSDRRRLDTRYPSDTLALPRKRCMRPDSAVTMRFLRNVRVAP